MTSQQCEYRKLIGLYNIPPPRYTPVSPYPQYNSKDLDMRRKAEILLYRNTDSNQNTSTKKERYARLVSANRSTVNLSRTNCTAVDALNVKSAPLPGYYSDVPGAKTMLFYDPTMPLYLKSNSQPSPSIILPQDLNQTITNIQQYQ